MGQNHSSSFTSSLMRNSMLFDHLHQFLTALIHRPHATFCPALQNVFARKVDFIGCRRRFNQLAFRLYCTSFTHLLQFHICRIKTFLLSGCITGLARLAPAKACHAGAGTVGPAPCCLRRPRRKPRLNLQGRCLLLWRSGVSLARLHGERCTPDLFAGTKKKSTVLPTKYSAFLVENSGNEPLAACMPCKRYPS